MRPRKRRRLENGVRRSLELFILAFSLIVGLAVVGGCGGVGVFVYKKSDAVTMVLTLLGGATIVIGSVYLATSMSRDVRLLQQKMLEEEEEEARTARR